MDAPRRRHAHGWRLALTSRALLALAALPNAQTEQARPTFETHVDYVAVPVRVLDNHGEFVRGLTASDFRVREDGKSQVIATFTAVDIPLLATGTTGIPATIDAPTVSNERFSAEGRVYAIVADDLVLEADYTLKVRNLLREFIARRLAANDLAAIVRTSTTELQDFTTNRQLLTEAVEQITGSFDPEHDRPAIGVFRKKLRTTLLSATQSLGSIRDRQKALVLVSPGFICYLVRDFTGRVREDGMPVSCGELFDAAVRAGVSIYTVDPRGARAPGCAKAAWSGETCFGARVGGASAKWGFLQPSAQTLEEETGGFVVTWTNNFDAFFDRIVRDNSAYYLIGYYSTNNRADGRFRKHDIRVSLSDVRVVHRAGYLAPRQKDRTR